MPKHQKRRGTEQVVGVTEVNDLPCGRHYSMRAGRARLFVSLHAKRCPICSAYDFQTAQERTNDISVGHRRHMSATQSNRYRSEVARVIAGTATDENTSQMTRNLLRTDDPGLLEEYEKVNIYSDHGTCTAIYEKGYEKALLTRIQEGGCGLCGRDYKPHQTSDNFCPDCAISFVPEDHPNRTNKDVIKQITDMVVAKMKETQREGGGPGRKSEDEQYCQGVGGSPCNYCSYIYEGWGGEFPCPGWVCDKCLERRDWL